MPGNVQASVVSPQSTVLPKSLCTSFVEVHAYAALYQSYHDGTLERSLITDGINPPQDLRMWKLSQRLSPSQLSTLSTFWQTTVQGGLHAFYYYDPYSPLTNHPIGSNYDATGVSTQGRYTCFFRGRWKISLGIGRSDIPELLLVQVA